MDADEDGFRANEMGVIPFSKRTMADTARFSMPGAPCLYLGNTSYVCWLELGKPADHRFNVAPVYLDGTQKVFDLAIDVGELYSILQNNNTNVLKVELKDNIGKSLLQRLILAMCSSFRVKENNRIFKSEYMIPQMIMISCQKLGMDEVLYYSCKTSRTEIAAVNVALYAKYPLNKFGIHTDLADISNHMRIGDPYNYSLFKQYNEQELFEDDLLWIDNCKWIKSTNVQNKYVDYREMIFHDFDKHLLLL